MILVVFVLIIFFFKIIIWLGLILGILFNRIFLLFCCFFKNLVLNCIDKCLVIIFIGVNKGSFWLDNFIVL